MRFPGGEKTEYVLCGGTTKYVIELVRVTYGDDWEIWRNEKFIGPYGDVRDGDIFCIMRVAPYGDVCRDAECTFSSFRMYHGAPCMRMLQLATAEQSRVWLEWLCPLCGTTRYASKERWVYVDDIDVASFTCNNGRRYQLSQDERLHPDVVEVMDALVRKKRPRR